MSAPRRYATIPIPKNAAGEVIVDAGSPCIVHGWTNKAVQVQGTGWAFTFTLEQRLRGGAWQAIATATALTAAEIGDIIPLADDVEEIRMDVTVVTTQDDTFAVPLIGIDHNAD